jgi:hypothetical protein
MTELTIVLALRALGINGGWVANEHGIILWERDEPQPTEAELVAAGWQKPETTPEEATPE